MKKLIGISLIATTLAILGSVLVMAQETSTVSSTTPSSTIMKNGKKPIPPKPGLGNKTKPLTTATTKVKPVLDIACVKAAVAKRDSTVLTAWTTKTTKLQAAFAKRSTELQAAWDKTVVNQRNASLKLAWKTFTATEKVANKEFIVAKNTAWKTYKEEMKNCGTNAISSDVPNTDEEKLPQ